MDWSWIGQTCQCLISKFINRWDPYFSIGCTIMVDTGSQLTSVTPRYLSTGWADRISWFVSCRLDNWLVADCSCDPKLPAVERSFNLHKMIQALLCTRLSLDSIIAELIIWWNHAASNAFRTLECCLRIMRLMNMLHLLMNMTQYKRIKLMNRIWESG